MQRRDDAPVLQREADTSMEASRLPARERASGALANLTATSRAWVHGGRASLTGLRVRGALTLLVVCVAMLSIGASTSLPSAPDPDPTVSAPVVIVPTATLYPTATPTPLPPPPQSVPAGWQVYRGHHFAVAYPPAWTAVEHVVQGSNGADSEVSVSFNSDDGSYSVGIAEHEGLDAATMQQYCSAPGTHTTFAGLPVIASTTAGTLRMYIFVSAGGVAYTLLSQANENSPDIASLDDTILATFRPEVMTSGCG